MAKEKIAILTWVNDDNYGTCLQAYALNRKIRDFGYDAVTINYKAKDISKVLKILKLLFNPLFTIKKIYRFYIKKERNRTLVYENQLERHKRFVDFRNQYIPLSDIYIDDDFNDVEKRYDNFIVGSDQIWNTIRINHIYYLDFIHESLKKNSYAPSFGSEFIKNIKIKKFIKKCLISFNNISVREESGKSLVKELLNLEVPVVLDPTFLLTKEEWEKIEDKNFVTPDNYILCYFLGRNEQYWTLINEYAKEKELKLVVIPIYEKDKERSDYVFSNIGPSQFIKLVNNASMIFTDSYHGTIFSILFSKEFLTFFRFNNREANKSNQNTRITSLLNKFNLNDHLHIEDSKSLIINNIDYLTVSKEIERLREHSFNYLLKCLKKEKRENSYEWK